MGLGRFLRAEWRDRKARTSGVLVTAGVFTAAAVGTVLTGGAAAPVFLFGLIPLGVTWWADDKNEGNYLEWGGDKKLVGDNRALESIDKVQNYIEKLTRNMMHLQKLPPHIEKKIIRQLEDIRPSLKDIRFFNRLTKEPLQEKVLDYSRWMFDEKGVSGRAVIAMVTPENIILPPRDEVKPEVSALELYARALGNGTIKKALPAPQKMTADFMRLTGEVKELQEKVAAIENPKPVELDKAVYRKIT